MEPLTVMALGAAGLYLYTATKKKPATPVKGKSGKIWLTRVPSVVGSGDSKVTLVEVYAPRNSFGPHQEVLVVTYRQQASDKQSRVAVSTGPHALPLMITEAAKDFGVKKPGSPGTA